MYGHLGTSTRWNSDFLDALGCELMGSGHIGTGELPLRWHFGTWVTKPLHRCESHNVSTPGGAISSIKNKYTDTLQYVPELETGYRLVHSIFSIVNQHLYTWYKNMWSIEMPILDWRDVSFIITRIKIPLITIYDNGNQYFLSAGVRISHRPIITFPLIILVGQYSDSIV